MKSKACPQAGLPRPERTRQTPPKPTPRKPYPLITSSFRDSQYIQKYT